MESWSVWIQLWKSWRIKKMQKRCEEKKDEADETNPEHERSEIVEPWSEAILVPLCLAPRGAHLMSLVLHHFVELIPHLPGSSPPFPQRNMVTQLASSLSSIQFDDASAPQRLDKTVKTPRRLQCLPRPYRAEDEGRSGDSTFRSQWNSRPFQRLIAPARSGRV